MPRNVRTARGDEIDFDTIVIKQALAQAPMNIEVARRKEFIDSKEGKIRGAKKEVAVEAVKATTSEFEVLEPILAPISRVAEPVPDLPIRDVKDHLTSKDQTKGKK